MIALRPRLSLWLRVCAAPFVLLAISAATPHEASAQRATRPTFEVTEASLQQVQQALTDGRVTSRQLVAAYRARIAAYDLQGPALNAMIRVNPRADADAATLDAERKSGNVRGPMHGIPVILKDNFSTVDMPTTAGSLALAGMQTPTDAYVVTRLRAAGAIILGKANMSEFAAGIMTISSLGGQTRNPYDPTRCPGGSSGGTGAAIAASFAAIGWGSDTCGSIRIPSAFNNLVGLRPSQGLSSRTGIVPLSHTQDIGGPMARSAADLAIALDATVGTDAVDTQATGWRAGRPLPHFVDSLKTATLKGARIGLLMNYMRPADFDAEILDTIRASIKMLRGAEAEVVEITVPDLDSLLARTSVMNHETKADLATFFATIPTAPVHSLKEIADAGLFADSQERRYLLIDTVPGLTSDAYEKAVAKQTILRARMAALLDSLKLDALIYPTVQRRPVQVGDQQAGSTCALSAFSGFPALSMQAGFTSDGLPVGIELYGRPFSDARLVALAYAYEQLTPRRRTPSTTPPLVNGRAPAPQRIAASARSAGGVARATFTYDAPMNQLRWSLRVEGKSLDRVHAVVLRRFDAANRSRIVRRLAGPGIATATGTSPLTGIDRQALLDGKLVLAIYTADGASPDTDGHLTLPK